MGTTATMTTISTTSTTTTTGPTTTTTTTTTSTTHGRHHGFFGFLGGGTKQDSRAERAKKKFCTPTFPNVGGTSKQISVEAIEYIEICCLIVTLINIGRPRPMVL